MKKIIAIIVIFSAFGLSNAKASGLQNANDNEQNQIELNMLPYGKKQFVPMTPIYEHAQYTVYRVKSDFLQNIPSCQPVGENYHYFIYKNGAFHLTVNKCNKNKVFSFLKNDFALV